MDGLHTIVVTDSLGVNAVVALSMDIIWLIILCCDNANLRCVHTTHHAWKGSEFVKALFQFVLRFSCFWKLYELVELNFILAIVKRYFEPFKIT